MNYKQLKDKMHEKLNSFDKLFYAFDEDQFDENYEKYKKRYPEIDGKKIFSLGYGGYAIHDHCVEYYNLLKEIDKMKKDFLAESDENQIDALVYELGNHEYIITYDETDAVNVVYGKEPEELTEQENNNLYEAIKRYKKSVEW